MLILRLSFRELAMAESLRSEAARRGITVYRVRVERGAQRGLSRSVAVGKPKRGELTIREAAKGLRPARRAQPKKYRVYWTDDQDVIRAAVDSDTLPDMDVGDEGYGDDRYASRTLHVAAIVVAR